MSKTCIVCGKEHNRTSAKDFPLRFCSYGCYEKWLILNKEPNCKCEICGKPLYMKPYRLKRLKHHVTCSIECSNKYKSIYYSGTGNPQYGIRGKDNSSFKDGDIINDAGYVLEYCEGHPYSKKSGRVLQHRLVVERNYSLFDDKYFEVIDGKHYLKKEYVVHHKNKIKSDNRIENLKILTKEEHSRLHAMENEIIRDPSNGRIIGVEKLSKNGED